MSCKTRPQPSKRLRARLFATFAALTACAASMVTIAQSPAKPEASATLPPALDVSITALPRPASDGANARLAVRYARGSAPPETIPLDIDGRVYPLKRDPRDPQRYTGAVPFDFEAFVAEQARRKELAAAKIVEPVFRHRSIVGKRPHSLPHVAYRPKDAMEAQLSGATGLPPDVATHSAGSDVQYCRPRSSACSVASGEHCED
jgi:hypothetical protein